MTALHDDELALDVDLVRRLVAQSLPQHAASSLEPLAAAGSSNALFRLGDELLVRLPRQPGGSATIEKEARWLPVIATAVTTAVPEVVAVGEPGFGYPEKWAVTRWIDGHVPAVPWDSSASPSPRALADDLAFGAVGRWFDTSALTPDEPATRIIADGRTLAPVGRPGG